MACLLSLLLRGGLRRWRNPACLIGTRPAAGRIPPQQAESRPSFLVWPSDGPYPSRLSKGSTIVKERDASRQPVIRLDDFLKRSGLVGTGGEAKLMIQSGEVCVNGTVEIRRRKQLAIGDVVEFLDQTLRVTEQF